jgi:hypothetical protein
VAYDVPALATRPRYWGLYEPTNHCLRWRIFDSTYTEITFAEFQEHVLKETHNVVGMSRYPRKSVDNVEWVQCDLFSLIDIENTLKNADVAVYLVHSMLPSARLTQGSFRDFDMILADNFQRAAKKANIKKIVYLSCKLFFDMYF